MQRFSSLSLWEEKVLGEFRPVGLVWLVRPVGEPTTRGPLQLPHERELEGASFKSKIFLLFPFREWLKTALSFLLSLARSLLQVARIRLLANAIRLPAESLIVSADTIRKPTHRSRMFLSAFGLKIAERGQFLQEKAVSLNVWREIFGQNREKLRFLATVGEHSFVKF